METIRALDVKILDALEDEKGNEEEIERPGDFWRTSTGDRSRNRVCYLGKIKKKVQVVLRRRTQVYCGYTLGFCEKTHQLVCRYNNRK